MIGNILLSIVTICTVISYLPQAIKLLRTKSSSDISVTSWILWVVSSFSYTLYAFIVSKDFMLIVETYIEFMFCLIILSLSLEYKIRKLKQK